MFTSTQAPPHTPCNIHSLPVEMLTRVFILGAGFDYPYSDSPFLLQPGKSYYGCSFQFQITASHVCRRWRDIAFRASSLWSVIHFREPADIPRAKAFTARCASASDVYLLDILIDTVAPDDHIQGVTLCRKELLVIFEMIMPHLKHWRSFHLKICDNECKLLARKNLSDCGPAPNLETLQLYHFEDYSTVQELYIATYRPPVVIFNNTTPRLRNVSLIGVNLPWERSTILMNMHDLELALHSDNIRPPYQWWHKILRLSPELHKLSLRYSGPKLFNGEASTAWLSSREKIHLPNLHELCLTDLDMEYLCCIMERMVFPNIKRLSLDLPELDNPDHDFSSFIELAAGSPSYLPMDIIAASSTLASSASTTSPITSSLSPPSEILSRTAVQEPLLYLPFPNISQLEILTIAALVCDVGAWKNLLRSLTSLHTLEIDFRKVPREFWKVLFGEEGEEVLDSDGSLRQLVSESAAIENSSEDEMKFTDANVLVASQSKRKHHLLLPRLANLKTRGMPGDVFISIVRHRQTFVYEHCGLRKWSAKWSEREKGRDPVLDDLLEKQYFQEGIGQLIRVECFDDEEDIEDDEDDEDEIEAGAKDGNRGEDTDEDDSGQGAHGDSYWGISTEEQRVLLI